MRVDLLTLYAFSDKAHAKQRELWRGFLALIMPVLLECDASEFERLLENAQCRSLEQLLSSIDAPKTAGELIWSVSGQFSEILGFEPELGLSAFLDVTLPTRVHAIGQTQSQSKENATVGLWLKSFRDLQQRPEFLEITQEWKRAFEVFFEDEDVLVEDDIEQVDGDVDSENQQSHSNSLDQAVDEQHRTHERKKTG